jgi:hypothetical protein
MTGMHHDDCVFVDIAEAFVLVNLTGGHVFVIASGDSTATTDAAIDRLRQLLPEKREEDGLIRITFHSAERPIARPIAVPV